jgi:hypothetical protein
MMLSQSGDLTYDLFAMGAARLAARLDRMAQQAEEQQQQKQQLRRLPVPPAAAGQGGGPEQGGAPAAAAVVPPPPPWRWVERRAPVTGERVGVLELERWLPAAPAEEAAAVAEGESDGGDDTAEAGLEVDEATATTATTATTTATTTTATAVAAPPSPPPRHRYLFHSAYSRTYRVPVLCFSATREDGAPLPPEQVRRDLSPWLQMHGPGGGVGGGDGGGGDGGGGGGDGGGDADKARSWDFYLARGEHPAEGWACRGGSSVYFLHPCRTAERMALLLMMMEGGAGGDAAAVAADRYLCAWLSAAGPAVGLPRPPLPEEEEEEEEEETTRGQGENV